MFWSVLTDVEIEIKEIRYIEMSFEQSGMNDFIIETEAILYEYIP